MGEFDETLESRPIETDSEGGEVTPLSDKDVEAFPKLGENLRNPQIADAIAQQTGIKPYIVSDVIAPIVDFVGKAVYSYFGAKEDSPLNPKSIKKAKGIWGDLTPIFKGAMSAWQKNAMDGMNLSSEDQQLLDDIEADEGEEAAMAALQGMMLQKGGAPPTGTPEDGIKAFESDPTEIQWESTGPEGESVAVSEMWPQNAAMADPEAAYAKPMTPQEALQASIEQLAGEKGLTMDDLKPKGDMHLTKNDAEGPLGTVDLINEDQIINALNIDMVDKREQIAVGKAKRQGV